MSEYTSIKNEVLAKLEANMPEIQQRFGIDTLGLFGSVSRGEDTSDSDVDVLYRFGTDVVRLRQFMGLKYYLEELFERNVDLVGIDWIESSIESYVNEETILFSSEAADVK